MVRNNDYPRFNVYFFNVTIIADRVKTFVEDYASSKLSQSDFDKKYNELKTKYDETSTKYQELVKLKEHRISQSKAINLFIKSLDKLI